MTAMSLWNGSERRSRRRSADTRPGIQLPAHSTDVKPQTTGKSGSKDHRLRLLYYAIPTRWAMLLSRLNDEPGRRRAPATHKIQWARA